jgi:hypothetical protein
MGFLNYIFKRKGDDERIRYLLKGSSKDYSVTFKCSGDCNPVHDEHVPRGWSHTFQAQPGDYYYFSAQANSRDAKLDLRIYKNGKLSRKILKEGDYPVATLSGCIC